MDELLDTLQARLDGLQEVDGGDWAAMLEATRLAGMLAGIRLVRDLGLGQEGSGG